MSIELWLLVFVGVVICENPKFFLNRGHRNVVMRNQPSSLRVKLNYRDEKTILRNASTLEEDNRSVTIKSKEIEMQVVDLIYALPEALMNRSIIIEDETKSASERSSALKKLRSEHPKVYCALQFIFSLFSKTVDDSNLTLERREEGEVKPAPISKYEDGSTRMTTRSTKPSSMPRRPISIPVRIWTTKTRDRRKKKDDSSESREITKPKKKRERKDKAIKLMKVMGESGERYKKGKKIAKWKDSEEEDD